MKRLVKLLSFSIIVLVLLSLIKLPSSAKAAITNVEAPTELQVDDQSQQVTFVTELSFTYAALLYYDTVQEEWVDSYCSGGALEEENTYYFDLENNDDLVGEVQYKIEITEGKFTYESSVFTIKWIGFTIHFDCSASGTNETMNDIENVYGYYEIPDCKIINKEGKIFTGWVDDEDTDYHPGDEPYIDSGLTLHAEYKMPTLLEVNYFGGDLQVNDTLVMNQLNIYLELDNGDDCHYPELEECVVKLKGEEVDLKSFKFSKKGVYNFDVTCKGLSTVFSVEVFQKVTKYKITYDKGEGEGEMAVDYVGQNGWYFLKDSQFTAPDDQEFVYWLCDEVRYNSYHEIQPTSDLTFTAIYRDVNSEMVTVTLDAGRGEGKPQYYDMDPGKFTLPECTFTAPEKYQFCGWDVYNDILQPGEKIDAESDHYICAKYERIIKVTSISAQYESVVGVGGKLSSEKIKITLTFEDNTTEVMDGSDDYIYYYVNDESFYLSDYKWKKIGKQKISIEYEDCSCEMEFEVVSAEEAEQAEEANNQAEAAQQAKEQQAKKPFPAWAIILIVLGSVLVLGTGGFAVYWFVIKKKSLADLMNIFKTKKK